MQTNPMESSANKPLERVSGENRALAALAADHEKVRQLAEDFQAALEATDEAQRNIVRELCQVLEIHTALEEEILYPAAARIHELAVLVDQAREDHRGIKELIDEIRSLEPDDQQVAGLVLQLAEDAEEHVVEEESVLFPELERRMRVRLDELGDEMERMRRRMLEI